MSSRNIVVLFDTYIYHSSIHRTTAMPTNLTSTSLGYLITMAVSVDRLQILSDDEADNIANMPPAPNLDQSRRGWNRSGPSSKAHSDQNNHQDVPGPQF